METVPNFFFYPDANFEWVLQLLGEQLMIQEMDQSQQQKQQQMQMQQQQQQASASSTTSTTMTKVGQVCNFDIFDRECMKFFGLFWKNEIWLSKRQFLQPDKARVQNAK